ncbi:LysM peptidoglycan-binding domain-containing protein [Geopsychrobacter electrodiphilus]|uniref:LysM peptidoglycan-binding domain-containing protein n=1 Tax=Geopsychrobacter electrodiphilus TaxID=225196 RepID=UPI00037EDDBC|nr:LysM peptidoglycan-binding domain-containing protein [Geopsychrobacter electrodiphilus]
MRFPLFECGFCSATIKRLVCVLLLFGVVGCMPAAEVRPGTLSALPTPAASDTGPASVSAASALAPPAYDAKLTAAVLAGLMAPVPPSVEDFIAHRPPLQYTGDIPLTRNPRIDALIKYYTGPGRTMFGHWLERAAKHIPRIQMVFASEGLPLDLAYLAMIESGFNEKAYSWANAAGPWQFIESTGRNYGLENNWWLDERRDIEKSTRAAAGFLKDLEQRFDGEWYLAIAAYNAGGGKISQAIRSAGSRDFWALAQGDVLQAETKNYVPKLLAALTIVSNLEAYGFADLNFEPQPKYEFVTLPTTTDLEVVAELSGSAYEELKDLNPELKRWCSPPGVRDYKLRVPRGHGEMFTASFADLPVADRARYHRHKLVAGDTLRSLAHRYRIQVEDIVSLNRITNPRALRIGTDLILPLREGFSRLPFDEMVDDYQRSHRKRYTVREGDSLWKIAQRFNVQPHDLRVWNRLGWSNLLRPGQVLSVSAQGKKTKRQAKKTRSSGPLKKLVYQVQSGDTLWGIGRQFDVATNQIRLWNDLSQKHVLKPGQKLTLHVPLSRSS